MMHTEYVTIEVELQVPDSLCRADLEDRLEMALDHSTAVEALREALQGSGVEVVSCTL